MILEVNLVRTQSIYGSAFGIVARERAVVENGEQIMSQIIKVLSDNIEVLDSAIADKGLVAQIGALKMMTVDEFVSLRYRLAATSGLDILVFGVSEQEVNANEIPAGTLEYNVIDTNWNLLDWVCLGTKIPVSENDYKLTDIYEKMAGMYDLFKGDLFSYYADPLTQQIEVLKGIEAAVGSTPTSITTYINSVFEYCGKKLIVIYN